MSDLREQILAADDLDTVEVEVEEWGCTVGIREMTALERDAFEAEALSRDGQGNVEVNMENIRARLLVKVLVDPESGERLFADDEVGELGGKSGAVLSRLFQDAQRVNGLTAEAVEELAGN